MWSIPQPATSLFGPAAGTGLSYRLDDAKETVDVDIRKGQDAIPIAANGNPFYPPQAAWFDLGTLQLTQASVSVHVVSRRCEGGFR